MNFFRRNYIYFCKIFSRNQYFDLCGSIFLIIGIFVLFDFFDNWFWLFGVAIVSPKNQFFALECDVFFISFIFIFRKIFS